MFFYFLQRNRKIGSDDMKINQLIVYEIQNFEIL